ncbi:hypothetical protein AcV7_000241 [Taiwanofungus camphoratus]|nr:hypothetical protein AcV7_000241 [Antrodia cinnamomea]
MTSYARHFTSRAGLGISIPPSLSSLSSSTSDHSLPSIFSDTLSESSSVQTDITPPASPSDDKILYPRIPLIKPQHIAELVSPPGLHHIYQTMDTLSLHDDVTNEMNDRGYEAECEDDGKKRRRRKRKFTRIAHASRAMQPAAKKPKKPQSHTALGLGLPSIIPPSANRRTACIGLGIDLPTSFPNEPDLIPTDIDDSPSPLFLGSPHLSRTFPNQHHWRAPCTPLSPPWAKPPPVQQHPPRQPFASIGLGLGINLPIAISPAPVAELRAHETDQNPYFSDVDIITYLVTPTP